MGGDPMGPLPEWLIVEMDRLTREALAEVACAPALGYHITGCRIENRLCLGRVTDRGARFSRPGDPADTRALSLLSPRAPDGSRL